MSKDIIFTPDQLRQGAALLPDMASTAAVMVELELDDHIHRHSERYPHYRHYDIVPPRPVISFRRGPRVDRWEFSGRVELLPYEAEEAQQEGLEAWLRRKIGPRLAYLEIGVPDGATVPVTMFVRGSKTAADAAYASVPVQGSSVRAMPGRDRVAPPGSAVPVPT
jgi:hypothetical protein